MVSKGFDDRDGLIWYDGRMVEWKTANVHLLTHAMHYASGVFEAKESITVKFLNFKNIVRGLLTQLIYWVLKYHILSQKLMMLV